MSEHSEKVGERLVLFSVALAGFYPLLAHYGSALIPPVQFAAITTFLSGLVLLVTLLLRGEFIVRLGWKLWLQVLMVCVFVASVPYGLIFYGASKTSGINTALLLQSELLFSFFFYHVVYRESITRKQFGGALLMLIGVVAILYRGRIVLHVGDLFIIGGAALFPLGNVFAKSALKQMPPILLMCYRGLIGGGILFGLSGFTELAGPISLSWQAAFYIFLQAIIINSIAKVIWYDGLRRLPVSRAIYIGSFSPVISVAYAVMFFHELPTLGQSIGLIITLGGLYMLMAKPSLSLAPPDLV